MTSSRTFFWPAPTGIRHDTWATRRTILPPVYACQSMSTSTRPIKIASHQRPFAITLTLCYSSSTGSMQGFSG